MDETKTQLKHPDPQKAAPQIASEKYTAVRAAILEAVPDDAAVVHFTGLADQVARRLPKETLDTLGSVGWYTG